MLHLYQYSGAQQLWIICLEEWNDGMMEEWNYRKPKGKPQRGEILIELMGSIEFGGAAHRNMKLDYWELDFFGDNNVSLRYSFVMGELACFLQTLRCAAPLKST